MTDKPNEMLQIWLEPECCADKYEGRRWADHDAFETCEEGGKPAKYIRSDILELIVQNCEASASTYEERVAVIKHVALEALKGNE